MTRVIIQRGVKGIAEMCVTAKALFVSCVWILAFTTRPEQEQSKLPKFEDFSVSESWTGPPATVKLTSHEERLFRTALREAAKQPPNFAGHFRFVSWGCGTMCLGGAVVDLKTGEIVQPPLAKRVRGEEHWIFCTSMFENSGTEYRRESSLFVIRCGSKVDQNGNNTPDAYYFNFLDGQFTQLVHISRKGKF
jgi:hypothetical protein